MFFFMRSYYDKTNYNLEEKCPEKKDYTTNDYTTSIFQDLIFI